MNFDLFTLWARLESEPEAPWCIDAWDEFSIDGNESGWAEAIEKGKKDAEGEVRIVRIRIRHEDILDAFAAPVVVGEVVE